MTQQILVVGDTRDVHLRAVLAGIAEIGAPEPLVFDAQSLMDGSYGVIIGERLTFGDRTIDLRVAARGWLRRSSPSLWGAGVVTGSLESVRRRAFLSLVASIARVGGIDWLTSVDAMLRAEDRLTQLEVARQLELRTPRTVVSSSTDVVREILGDRFVVKPLAMGYFQSDRGAHAVYSTELGPLDLSQVDFADAPFVAQETIRATEHLRIVTVGERAWVSTLDAPGRPLDWRQQEEAHCAWTAGDDPHAASDAVALAKAFGVGYSSQDWIHDGTGRAVFVDLNPGGQWLFLPDEISIPVTYAIAGFLVGEDP